jgi:hypothetical protein
MTKKESADHLIDCSPGLSPGVAFHQDGACPGVKGPRPEAGVAEAAGGALLTRIEET